MPPEPTVLAFDTSAAHCAAAFVWAGRLIAERHEEMARGQAERLFPLLEEVLAAAGKGWGDLDRIGVGIGPGNFTGTRIAVSAARGLALSLGIPAIGVSALDALAEGTSGPVLACLPAPRGHVYVQGYRMRAALPPQLADPAALPAEWAEPGLVCVGPAAGAVAPALGARAAQPAQGLAAAIATVAAARGLPGPRPAPLYLRPADAAPSSDAPPRILP